jgi:hypothetical protein
MATNASNLRWRSRFSKEAVNSWDGDDHSVASFERNGKSIASCAKRQPWTLVLDGTAATAAASAVLSLQFTHVWFMAVASTLTVAFSLLTVWQHRRLKKLQALRHQQNQTRRTVHSIKQQNERLYRNLSSLDHSIDRFYKVQSDLTRIVGKQQSLQKLTATCQEYKQVNAAMRDKLQQRVATQIVQAVVGSDVNGDFSLTAAEMERLLVQLATIPGVNMDETLLRQQLAGDRSLAAILDLLRQVTAEPVNRTKVVLKTQRSIFTYQPDQLLLLKTKNQTTTLMERHEC